MRAALLLTVLVGLADAGRSLPAAMVYDSNYGAVTLYADGAHVHGTYPCCGSGTVDGTVTGATIHYRWQSGSGNGGGVWTIDRTTGHLDGTWGWNGSETDGGRWDLVPQKPSAQIAN